MSVDGHVIFKGELRIKGKYVPLTVLLHNKDIVNTTLVFLNEDICLPPYSETIVEGILDPSKLNKHGMLETTSLKEGVEIASMLVRLTELIPIRIMNNTKSMEKFRKGEFLGILWEVDLPTEVLMDSVSRIETVEASGDYAHLEELTEKIAKDLSGDQLEKGKELLYRFSDVFAKKIFRFRSLNRNNS